MIVITLQQFFVLLWIFCITKVILHGFRINIIGISINRYFYEYNLDDKNVIKEYHRGRCVRSLIILILDTITLVISHSMVKVFYIGKIKEFWYIISRKT